MIRHDGCAMISAVGMPVLILHQLLVEMKFDEISRKWSLPACIPGAATVARSILFRECHR